MTQKTLEKDYINVTDEWIKDSKPNSHKIIDSYFYISNNKIYIVDGKKVVLDYSLRELEVAQWLEDKFGGEIYMNPRVNFPKNIKTADYWWNGEYWDLKEIRDSTSLKRAIDNAIKDCREQSHNFIIDITGTSIPTENIIVQIEKLFYIKNSNRKWVNKIIVKKHNSVIAIYIRKKEATPAQLQSLNGQGLPLSIYILTYFFYKINLYFAFHLLYN